MMLSNVCTTATFMAFGMFEVDAKRRTYGADGRSNFDIYIVWDSGAVELHSQLAQYAIASEKLVDLLTTQFNFDFPGVYDYEVSEPFGTWFAEHVFEHADTPSTKDGLDCLIKLVISFFSQTSSKDDIVESTKKELTHIIDTMFKREEAFDESK